jgi:hypothetical protein
MVAIVLTSVLLALAIALALSGKPTDSTPLAEEKVSATTVPPSLEPTSTQVIIQVSPSPSSPQTPLSPSLPTSTLRAPTPTAPDTTAPPISPTPIPLPPTLAPASWALLGNKYGIHLLLDDDRDHWVPDVWPEHLQAARQIVGEGGYVVQLIRLDDLDVARWQLFLDLCAQEHLIPILRLVTTFDHDNKWWNAPPKDADGQGYTKAARRYREFLSALKWPATPRYAIVHNEPNRGDEWSNQPNAAEYAQFLLDVGQALRSIGVTVLGPALDLYAPHSNGQIIAGYRYIDAETFLDEMAAARPEAFDVIGVLAAHAYPPDPFRFDPSRQEFRIDYAFGAQNPNHLEPPAGLYNRGINSYRWELWKLEQLIGPRAATLPVLITESGWRHGPTQDPEARDSVHAEISFETQSAYLDLAFRGNGGRYPDLPDTGWTPWNDDPRVLGVVLFALGGYPKDWGHTNWVTVDDLGHVTGFYPITLPR